LRSGELPGFGDLGENLEQFGWIGIAQPRGGGAFVSQGQLEHVFIAPGGSGTKAHVRAS
jgi:hypothetical protein